MDIILNNELNGIELVFEGKPENEILTAIKGAGFRWHNVKKLWYAKQTAERIALAESISGGHVAKVAEIEKKLSLWDRCQVADIPEHDKYMSTKEIAELTRKHIKSRFPEIKFSCRIGSGGWAAANEVNFYFKSAPFSKDSIYFEAVREYIKAWLWSFNYDNSDSMIDYFDRGFYENISTWDFEEVAPTEEQTADLANFDEMKAASDAEKKAEEEAAYLLYIEECKKAEEEAEKRRQEDKKKHAEIIQHVKIVDIPENEKIIISGLMTCGSGKECNISEIIEEGTTKNKSALIKRCLYFEDSAIYNIFCSMFLYDFDFLSGCGGTGTLDTRVTDDNIYKLNQIERDSVKWIMWDCVAVYLNNELKLIIDPEGYTYARYVNIVCDDYTSELLTKAEEKEEKEEKEHFYIPAPIAEQAQNIKPGNYTIISIDPWVLSASAEHVKIENYYIEDYAQYKNAVYITYTKNGKRKSITKVFHDSSSILIYAGYVQSVPAEMLKTKINDNMSVLNYCGGGVYDFMIAACKYYKSIGHNAIINTLQY